MVLKGGHSEGEAAVRIANEPRNWIAKEIGPIAKPKDIRFGDNLPKTRSGKISAACCARLPRASRSRRTSPHWRIRRFWSSSPRSSENYVFHSIKPRMDIDLRLK